MFRSDRRTFLRGATTVGTLGLSGCVQSLGGTSYKREIGMPTPQSGPLAPAGQAGIRGAQVAIDDVNEALDEDLSLRLEDGQASPETARRVSGDMIDDNVPVITGTFSSDVSNALSELAEQEEVPFMTAISVAPQITSTEDDYTFRLSGDTNQKLQGQSQFLQDQGVSALGIIAADYSFGQSAVEFYRNRASDYGLTVEQTSLVSLRTNNFVPELRKIDTDVVDALFFPFPGGNGPTLIQQAREEGLFDAVDLVIGHDSYGTELFKQALGDDIVGLYNWGVDLSNERSMQASQTMRERFDVPMDSLSLPNYDAVAMIGQAVQQAGSVEPGAIRDTLADMEYQAASGWNVAFNDAGDNSKFRMHVSQWTEQGGEIRNTLQYRSDVVEP